MFAELEREVAKYSSDEEEREEKYAQDLCLYAFSPQDSFHLLNISIKTAKNKGSSGWK